MKRKQVGLGTAGVRLVRLLKRPGMDVVRQVSCRTSIINVQKQTSRSTVDSLIPDSPFLHGLNLVYNRKCVLCLRNVCSTKQLGRGHFTSRPLLTSITYNFDVPVVEEALAEGFSAACCTDFDA